MMHYRAGNQVREVGNEQNVTNEVEPLHFAVIRTSRMAIWVKVKNEMPSGRIACPMGSEVLVKRFRFSAKKLAYLKQTNRVRLAVITPASSNFD